MSKDTLHESAQLYKREGQELAPAATGDAVQPWLHPEAVEPLAVGNSKGKGKGPDQSCGKGDVSVMGQEGLFNFPHLGCVNAMQWQHDHWNANEVDNHGDGNWPGRLAQLCKTKKIEKIESASQFAQAAEQLQLVKKRKKVSWKAGVRRGYRKYRW